MPVAADTKLAPNFLAWELGANKPAATMQIVANTTRVAQYLQTVRGILGVPLDIGDASTETSNSGFRTPDENNAVNGSPTSDHLTGLSGDFVPRGVSMYRAFYILKDAIAAGKLPPFDQIIYYPIDGHIHVGLGPRMRGEIRIKFGEGYPILTADLEDKLPGAVKDAIAQVASALSQVGPVIPVLFAFLLLFIVLS